MWKSSAATASSRCYFEDCAAVLWRPTQEAPVVWGAVASLRRGVPQDRASPEGLWGAAAWGLTATAPAPQFKMTFG